MPTISELAEFMEISGPNMAYRISNLMKKGYVNKVQSKDDKREYFLEVTEKFYNYYDIRSEYINTVLDRVAERFPNEDIEVLAEILSVMSNELMPEITVFMDSLKSKTID